MTSLRLISGTTVTLGGNDFQYLGEKDSNIWLTRKDDPNARETISAESLVALVADEKAEIHRPLTKPRTKVWSSSDPASIMALLDEEQFRKTCHRWAIVLSVYSLASRSRLSLSDRSLQENESAIIRGAEEILQRKAKYRACDNRLTVVFPSTGQIRRWCRSWRACGGSVLSLVNARSLQGVAPKIWSPDQQRYLDRACEIFLRSKGRNRKLAVKLVRSEFEKENERRKAEGEPKIAHISVRAFSDAIGQLDDYIVDLMKDGRDYALSRNSPATPIDGPLFAGARIEIDAVRMDVMTLLTKVGVATRMTREQLDDVPRIRVTVTMAVDVASRCILGFFISENEDTISALRVLNLVTRNKTSWSEAAGCRNGWPQGSPIYDVFTDAGPPFANDVFMRAVVAAGGNLIVLPTAVARLRGTCERVFRTINSGLLVLLSGETFGGIEERGQYDSRAWAVHTIDDLTTLLTRFIVDVYHTIPRAKLGGLSPSEMWDYLEDEWGASPLPSPRVRRLSFGYREKRTVSNEGVEITAIPFHSRELVSAVPKRGLKDQEVFVDPFDLGAVTVRIGNQLIDARAPDPKFRGVTIDEWVDGQKLIWPSADADKEQQVDVALEAIDAIRAHDDAARRRRGLTFCGITADKLRHVEEKRFFGLSLVQAKQDVSDEAPNLDGELPGQSMLPIVRPQRKADRTETRPPEQADPSEDPTDTSWWDDDDER